MTTKKYISARIVTDSGSGGFLNPPGHPEHTQSVETDLRRRPENRGRMSLSGAVTADYLPPVIRGRASGILKRWANENAGTEPDAAWVAQVLGYFRNCYRNPAAPEGQEWHAGNLVIDRDRDPMAEPADHAGINLIRQYYPGFQPTAEHFASAKWGT